MKKISSPIVDKIYSEYFNGPQEVQDRNVGQWQSQLYTCNAVPEIFDCLVLM
jgi:hypothetical protein